MEKAQVPYAGNLWHHNAPGSLATDIIFADTQFGNVFESFRDRTFPDFEITMWDTVHRLGRGYYTIKERHPVHWENRFNCKALWWTMEHSLDLNLAFVKAYKERSS